MTATGVHDEYTSVSGLTLVSSQNSENHGKEIAAVTRKHRPDFFDGIMIVFPRLKLPEHFRR